MITHAIRNSCNGYLRLLKTYPLIAQSSSTAFLMMSGDALSQLAFKKTDSSYDWRRSARYFAVGLLFVELIKQLGRRRGQVFIISMFISIILMGPALKIWYQKLDSLVKPSRAAAVKKMLLDQVFFAPPFLSTFLIIVSLVRGDSLQEVQDNLANKMPTILATSYKLWPAVQLLNFYLVPLHLRVLFVQIVALGWNTYLAPIANTKGDKEDYQLVAS